MCVSCRPWCHHSTEDRGPVKQTGGGTTADKIREGAARGAVPETGALLR